MSIAQEILFLLEKPRFPKDPEKVNPSPSLDAERDALKL
jgi:hypothetical protein